MPQAECQQPVGFVRIRPLQLSTMGPYSGSLFRHKIRLAGGPAAVLEDHDEAETLDLLASAPLEHRDSDAATGRLAPSGDRAPAAVASTVVCHELSRDRRVVALWKGLAKVRIVDHRQDSSRHRGEICGGYFRHYSVPSFWL